MIRSRIVDCARNCARDNLLVTERHQLSPTSRARGTRVHLIFRWFAEAYYRAENPRVGGSIPSPGTSKINHLQENYGNSQAGSIEAFLASRLRPTNKSLLVLIAAGQYSAAGEKIITKFAQGMADRIGPPLPKAALLLLHEERLGRFFFYEASRRMQILKAVQFPKQYQVAVVVCHHLSVRDLIGIVQPVDAGTTEICLGRQLSSPRSAWIPQMATSSMWAPWLYCLSYAWRTGPAGRAEVMPPPPHRRLTSSTEDVIC